MPDLFPGRADLPVRQGFSFAQVFTWYTDAPADGVYRGDWDTARIYDLNAMVKGSDGLVYAALVRTQGADPTTPSPSEWRALTLQDLTGWTAEMEIREGLGSTDPLLDLTATPTAGGSSIVLGGAAGTVTITLGKTDTADLIPRALLYDVALMDGGLRTPFLAGEVQVAAAVTR